MSGGGFVRSLTHDTTTTREAQTLGLAYVDRDGRDQYVTLVRAAVGADGRRYVAALPAVRP